MQTCTVQASSPLVPKHEDSVVVCALLICPVAPVAPVYPAIPVAPGVTK